MNRTLDATRLNVGSGQVNQIWFSRFFQTPVKFCQNLSFDDFGPTSNYLSIHSFALLFIHCPFDLLLVRLSMLLLFTSVKLYMYTILLSIYDIFCIHSTALICGHVQLFHASNRMRNNVSNIFNTSILDACYQLIDACPKVSLLEKNYKLLFDY